MVSNRGSAVLTTAPQVLDPASSGRMMWFDKSDHRAMFGDNRTTTPARLSNGQLFEVAPDMVMDFRRLPFADATFWHVVLDPPHLKSLGKDSWTALKYGALLPSWREDLRAGFDECFRVLKPNGTLIFKWNEHQIPIGDILALTDQKPLYGHRSGKHSRTHWIAFIKEASA